MVGITDANGNVTEVAGNFAFSDPLKANIDASNLSEVDVESWNTKLGASQLVTEFSATSISSITIDGLDLDNDKEYVIEFYINASSGGGGVVMQLNNDTTNNVVTVTTAAYGTTSITMSSGVDARSDFVIGDVWVYATNYRVILSKDSLRNIVHFKSMGWGGDYGNRYYRHNQACKPLATNLTSIKITSGVTLANAFIRIYKFATNEPIA